MLILAVDTSGRQGGITLARGSTEDIEVIESAFIEGGTFSAELIPQISQVLARHNLSPQQLQGLVAVTGPGSFTGLRVGLTAIKGLAEVLKLPIATVTSLEVLASAAGGNVIALLDAGRGEVYVGLTKDGAWHETLSPLAEAIGLGKSGKVVTGDAVLAAKIGEGQFIHYRSSEIAARLGLKKLLAGQTVDVLTLDANYVRESEVEYMLKLKK